MNSLSLTVRYLITALLPAFVMLAVLSSYFIYHEQIDLNQQLNNKGELLAKQLAPASEYAVFLRDTNLLEDIVRPLLLSKDIATVEIRDAENQLLLIRQSPGLTPGELTPENLRIFRSSIVLQDVPLESSEFSLTYDDNSKSVDNVIGSITLSLSQKEVVERRHLSIITAIGLGSVILLFSILFANRVAHNVSVAMNEISETIKLYKSNIFSAKIQKHSAGDLGITEKHVNELGEFLAKAKRRELEHSMVLEQARIEAVNANTAKSEFIAGMGHQLRTPLYSILGVLQLLEDTELTLEQQTLIETAIASNDHLAQYIDDIMDYSELESNQLSLQRKYFDPQRVLKRAIAPFISQSKQINTQINLFFDGLAQQTLVLSDENRFQQIIRYLLAYSLNSTEAGYIDLKMKSQPNPGHQTLLLTLDITDNGSGVSADRLPYMFDSAKRKDFPGSTSHSDLNGGSAIEASSIDSILLGLSIAKDLVELLGGTIDVNSAPDKGTHFYLQFNFPFKELEKNQDMAIAETTLIDSLDGRILLVEDNPVNQMVTKGVLNNLGAVVDMAMNGAIALEKFSNSDYQLVIMDCHMPVMDGYECARKIRAMESSQTLKTPILALTADNSELARQKCYDAGMDAVLTKPINKSKLWERANKLMAH